MHATPFHSIRVERSEAVIIVYVNHSDPVLRHSNLSHPLSHDGLQQLVVSIGEVLSVFFDVVRDRFQATSGGRKTDHRRRRGHSRLPTSEKPLGGLCQADQQMREPVWYFHN